MSPVRVVPEGVSGYRATGAVVAALVVGAILLLSDGTDAPPLIAAYALAVAYLAANAVDRVREHPAFDLASICWTAATLALLYLGHVERSPFFLALVILTALGIPVEAYNYRYGTSYLRIDY